MEKRELRHKVKTMKSLLTELEKERESSAVFERLEKTAAFMLSEHILMYHSLPDELSTRNFLAKWSGRKRFYLPRVNGVNLDILPYDESRLELGSFHIEEPTGEDLTDPSEIELIVVPGMAFDRKGRRLGRGKGFYDRLLQSSKATKIGIGYEFQLVEEVPSEQHDVTMDIIVTPSATIIVRNGSI